MGNKSVVCCCEGEETRELQPSFVITSFPYTEWTHSAPDQEPAHSATEEDLTSNALVSEFIVTLKRKSLKEPLGMHLEKSVDNEHLAIQHPAGEALSAWNAANPKKAVLPGDEILAVNGQCGDATAMVDQMVSKVEFELALRRYVQITVEVIKHGLLGLVFKHRTLEVADVKDSSTIWAYNKQSNACFLRVLRGDFLTELNGIRGMASIENCLQKCQDGEQLTMLFLRPKVKDASLVSFQLPHRRALFLLA